MKAHSVAIGVCVACLAGSEERVAPRRGDGADTAAVEDAQIAPNGRSIAYVLKTPGGSGSVARSSIWLVPFAGGDARRLTSDDADVSHPRWLADGEGIAFLARSASGAHRVFRMSSTGGDARAVTPESVDVSSFAWLRDGTRVVLLDAVPRADGSRLDVLNLTSGSIAPWPGPAAEGVRAFSASPSGSEVAAIVVSGTAPARVVQLSASGSSREIAAEAGDATDIAWSADAEWIAWIARRDSSARPVVRLAQARGGEPRILSGTNGTPLRLAWAADGRLSITIEGSGERHVDVVDVRTGSRATVLPPGVASLVGAASWSADGARYAIVGAADDHVPEVFAGSLPLTVPQGRDWIGAAPPPVRRITFSR